MRSKDVVLFPAWSRQQGEADHYLLCVEFLFIIFLAVIFSNLTGRVGEILTKYPLQVMLVAKREILFLDSLRPDGFGDEAYRTI